MQALRLAHALVVPTRTKFGGQITSPIVRAVVVGAAVDVTLAAIAREGCFTARIRIHARVRGLGRCVTLPADAVPRATMAKVASRAVRVVPAWPTDELGRVANRLERIDRGAVVVIVALYARLEALTARVGARGGLGHTLPVQAERARAKGRERIRWAVAVEDAGERPRDARKEAEKSQVQNKAIQRSHFIEQGLGVFASLTFISLF